MFRICTVTFEHTVNYGSCLQAYALKYVCEQLKIYEDEVYYDIIPVRKLKIFSFFSKKCWLRFFKYHYQQFIGYYFRCFDKNFFHFSTCYNYNSLKELNDCYDVFICGSDVIWNPDLNLNLGIYFLDFVQKYAFSYAASFGKTELSPDYLKSLQSQLSNLRQISVREADGIRIIEENTDRTAVQTVDPTLLLTPIDWNNIAEDPKIGENYIFVYLTHLYPIAAQFIEKLKNQTGMKIYYAMWGVKSSLKYRTYPPSPEKWIGLIRGAKYVITNSFHCTAFCVLYHKTFFTVVQGELGKGIYVRMYDFLKGLGLEERICNSVPETIDLSAPYYDGVDEKLEIKRQESLAFLRENLEVAYREKMERENN